MPVSGKSSSDTSLYFHIPFCRRKCPYCHFYVLPDKPELKELLLQALALDWKRQLPLLQGKRIVSIYFGGGTPSLFGSGPIGTILDWVRKSGIEIASDCEITLETNPEDTSLESMQKMADLGIGRISMGVQSLDDSSLNVLGRAHSSQVALAAIDAINKAGIKNLSIDLMYDLPEQTVASWTRTLQQLEKLPITHLSLYNLTFEPETVFFKRKKSLLPLVPSPDASLEMLEIAVAHMRALGFERYEISAFAKEGYASRHNSGYWTARPFLGFGPSAFSFWNGARFRNVPHLKRYTEALEKGEAPLDFEESLPYPDNLHELLAVQLRLLAGVDLFSFQARHGDLPAATLACIDELVNKGWISRTAHRIQLTDQGLLFYDSVATALI